MTESYPIGCHVWRRLPQLRWRRIDDLCLGIEQIPQQSENRRTRSILAVRLLVMAVTILHAMSWAKRP